MVERSMSWARRDRMSTREGGYDGLWSSELSVNFWEGNSTINNT